MNNSVEWTLFAEENEQELAEEKTFLTAINQPHQAFAFFLFWLTKLPFPETMVFARQTTASSV